MKSIFIVYAQSLTADIMTVLDKMSIRGYTKWETVTGRGSVTGEPHLGSHAWPSLNSSIIAVIEDDKVERLMAALKELDNRTSMQGLRAFVWNVESYI